MPLDSHENVPSIDGSTCAAPARTPFPSVTLSIGIQHESSQQSDIFPPRDIRIDSYHSWLKFGCVVRAPIVRASHARHNDDVDRAVSSQRDHFRGPSPPLPSNILLFCWHASHKFAARRPSPSQLTVTLSHHGSGGKHFYPFHPPESDPGKPLPRRLGFAEGAARYFRLRRHCPEGARQISPGQGDASVASVAAALGSLS